MKEGKGKVGSNSGLGALYREGCFSGRVGNSWASKSTPGRSACKKTRGGEGG